MKSLSVKEKIVCEEFVKKALIWLWNSELNAKTDYCENYLSDYMYSRIPAEYSEEFIKHCVHVAIKMYKQTHEIFREEIFNL